MSIEVRNDLYFVLYRYCCKGRYSVNIHLKCRTESGHPELRCGQTELEGNRDAIRSK